MPTLAAAIATTPDLTTVTSWPAAVVAVAGLIGLAIQQWRQGRVTRDIRHELKPNHGGSTRDAVDRLERGQEDLATTLADHIKGEPTRRRRTAITSMALAAVVSLAVSLTTTRR